MVWTKFEMKTMKDYHDLYLKYGKTCMQGGLSSISGKYSKANNKHLKSYNANQDWKHITA